MRRGAHPPRGRAGRRADRRQRRHDHDLRGGARGPRVWTVCRTRAHAPDWARALAVAAAPARRAPRAARRAPGACARTPRRRRAWGTGCCTVATARGRAAAHGRARAGRPAVGACGARVRSAARRGPLYGGPPRLDGRRGGLSHGFRPAGGLAGRSIAARSGPSLSARGPTDTWSRARVEVEAGQRLPGRAGAAHRLQCAAAPGGSKYSARRRRPAACTAAAALRWCPRSQPCIPAWRLHYPGSKRTGAR